MSKCEANLGCATTEELMREVISRAGEVWGNEIGFRRAVERVSMLAELLGTMPTDLREYRTVES
jgi:hypothetical protein